jgi:HD-like signal output (HDOD) protein
MRHKQDILTRLQYIDDLPTLPAVIERLNSEVSDPQADAGSVARIIEDDPAISARLLKVVNSAFYFGHTPVSSLPYAVIRLGFRAVCNIAMSTAVFSTFPPGQGCCFSREELWKHCIDTGITAEVLAEAVGGRVRSYGRHVLHLAGILHDIGTILLEQYFHREFRQAVDMSTRRGIPMRNAERQVLGADHAEAGYWLVQRWHLSEDMLQAIRWHHDPEHAMAEHRDLVVLIHWADHLTNEAPEVDSREEERIRILGVDIGTRSTVREQVARALQSSDVYSALMLESA